MRPEKILVLSALLCLCAIFPNSISAQEVLLGDADHPEITAASTLRGPRPAARTTAALSLPFFDDFSYDSLKPANALWNVRENDPRMPSVSTQRGVNPPSKGVATFDGATWLGRKYSTDLETGIRDTLASLAIDLEGKKLSDSIYLSFFVERGGNGEVPENTDSLVLLFDTSGNHDYVPVWSLLGGVGAEKDFQLYHVLVDDTAYMDSTFHFKFVCYGSLNGEFDQFHLDYVLMDEGRSQTDSTFSDVSPISIVQSPIYPYTSLPLEHFTQGGYVSFATAEVASAGKPGLNTTVNFAITDPVGGNAFTGMTTASGAAALPPFGNDTVIGTAFSDQAGNMSNFGAVRVMATATAAGDSYPANNSLQMDFGLDTIMGYDDGVADFGYGLLSAKSMCQEYNSPIGDSVTALWVNFSPTLHYNQVTNQSTCLDNKGFKVAVWDTLVPDSVLTQASHTVSYDSSLNDFVRYPFIRPVYVNGTFWVGIQQSDGMPVGVGFDSNNPVGKTYFEDISGDFLLSGNAGCMMVRVEFGGTNPFAQRTPQAERLEYALQLAPHPWSEGPLQVALTGPEPLRNLQAEVYSLQGQLVRRAERGTTLGKFELDLPDGLAAGMYLLNVKGTTRSGQPFVARTRLVVQGHQR